MSDPDAIADRVEIEALRGEFTDAAMMRDDDRLASLFTADGADHAGGSLSAPTRSDTSTPLPWRAPPRTQRRTTNDRPARSRRWVR
jgi:hypothetical protein